VSADWNRRLVNIARGIMAVYARQWRYARRDSTAQNYAVDCLRRALEWRDKSRRWKGGPV